MITPASRRVSLLALTLVACALAPAACVGDASDPVDEDLSSTSEAVVGTQSAVTVYGDAAFAGTSQTLTPGYYDIGALTVGNDAISSLRVPSGWRVTLYENAAFTGRSRSFTADSPWVGDDFNDLTSSIIVQGPAGSLLTFGGQATIQNASQNGVTSKCLIMSNNGQDASPSRYLWGSGDNGACGFPTKADLLSNKQGTWKLTPLGNNQFTIQNASQDGVTNKCLIMNNNGQDASPSRHLWGGGDNGFCGFPTKADLFNNKQAVWTLQPLGNDQYTIQNASQNGVTNKCLIMSNNGQDASPSRYLWGGGDNGFCGFPTKADLLNNKQAVWTISDLAPTPPSALPSDQALAAKFAPRLRFDGSANGYPMSAQSFYDQAVAVPQPGIQTPLGFFSYPISNNDPGTLSSGQIPTYYQTTTCDAQTRIMYWFFYGYQNTCDAFGNGSHNGDWENVMVTLSEDKASIAAVTYWMHGKRYTRLPVRGSVAIEPGTTHPTVYVGKVSHASLYNQGGSSNTCLPWEEFRNNTSGTHLDTWTDLVSLAGDAEPWIAADRIGSFPWGYDGVSTHPTRNSPTCSLNAADWSFEVPTWWHSECKAGDTDWGTFCGSGWGTYDYDWTLPTTDVGLLR